MCSIEVQKASIVWPDRLRPLRSAKVTETMTGSELPVSAKISCIATRAAFALSVSKMVSTSSRSAPPSINPRICSA